MGIASKIKPILPVSSRTVHAMYADLYRLFEVLAEQREEQKAFESKVELMLWELYRKEGESLDDAHKRLYSNMSPATGAMRLYQLASAQLLHEFDALCQREGLSYWCVSGTLLGAVRHHGFIPWDDDLDVGMTRQDLERLMQVVKDDPRYRVTVRYDRFVLCCQMRFSYADESVPCFVDLFSFDLVSSASEETFNRREEVREALKAALEADESLGFWNEENYYVEGDDPRSEAIRAHFTASLNELYDSGVIVRSLDEAEGVIWGIDNNDSFVRHHTWYLIPKEAVFPLGRVQFEGAEVNAPADADRCLSDIYGNIYELPDDLASHYHHISQFELNEDGSIDALRRVVSKGDC